jgi:hypothetical protein
MSIEIYLTINKRSIVEFLERNGIISLVQIVSNEFVINEADHQRMLLNSVQCISGVDKNK